MPVVYSEAFACALLFWVDEFVDEFDRLGQIPRHTPNHLHEIVIVELGFAVAGNLWQPESYVFVAGGVLAIRFELSYLTIFELV